MSHPSSPAVPPAPALRAAILIVSDRAASGERPDATAPGLAALLRSRGIEAAPEPRVIRDERSLIAMAIRDLARSFDVVVTSGGTGLAPRDVTPEATRDVIDRELPGFGEAMRQASRAKTPFADLSRATAGSCGRALVVNLPGSPKGALECLEAVLPAIPHAVRHIRGSVRDCREDLPPRPA